MSVWVQNLSELCTCQNPLSLALESGLEPWPFDQWPVQKPLFHLNVLSPNWVRYISLIGMISTFIWCRYYSSFILRRQEMNGSGLTLSQWSTSNIKNGLIVPQNLSLLASARQQLSAIQRVSGHLLQQRLRVLWTRTEDLCCKSSVNSTFCNSQFGWS